MTATPSLPHRYLAILEARPILIGMALSNHFFNAHLNKYPACPECDAGQCKPCTTDRGALREPHRSRLKLKAGTLIAIREDDARHAHKIRAVRTLAAEINGEVRCPCKKAA